MKQEAENKVFDCLYGKKNFLECLMCRDHEFCKARKEWRIRQRKVKKLKRIIYISLCVCMLLLFILGAILIIISSYNKSEKETNDYNSATNNQILISQIEKTKVIPQAELSADGPSHNYYYNISKEEKVMIAKVVWAEARGECYEGKVAVAAVVLNRYFYGKGQGFNRESIEAVITQPYQFANISNVTNEKLSLYPECMSAVEDACKGWDPTREMFKEGALFFYAPTGVTGYQAEIREGIKFLAIGNHNFHYDFEKVVEE